MPRCVGGAFLVGGIVQAWWLQQRGALLAAAMVGLGVVAIAWGLWRLMPGSGPPRRLILYPDGRVGLHAGGCDQEAWLAPCSLRLGRYTVLVLLCGRSRPRLRLLLGPGILAAADLAALERWLRGAAGRQGTRRGTGVD